VKDTSCLSPFLLSGEKLEEQRQPRHIIKKETRGNDNNYIIKLRLADWKDVRFAVFSQEYLIDHSPQKKIGLTAYFT
jgi:hypothetical protein